MNKTICSSFFLFLFFSVSIHAQDLRIFMMHQPENNAGKRMGFVSLSDHYVYEEHPDSQVNFEVEEMGIDSAKYFNLGTDFRKKFLSVTNFSESDSIYFFDYSKNLSVQFALKNLNLVACLNIYAGPDDWPYSQYAYMIGFEIDLQKLKVFGDDFYNVLAFIGGDNPFVHQKLKAIDWKKIEHKEFPIQRIGLTDTSRLRNSEYGDAYNFVVDDIQYFILDYERENMVFARRLLIINKATNQKLCERLYIDSEGTSLAPLNNIDGEQAINVEQWTGKLFKNESPVIFGFLYFSFGCPPITFLNPRENDLYISCDNRH